MNVVARELFVVKCRWWWKQKVARHYSSSVYRPVRVCLAAGCVTERATVTTAATSVVCIS